MILGKKAKVVYALSPFLLMIILASAMQVVLVDKVKLDVQSTRAKYNVFEDGGWVHSGTEYVYLFDGSKKMRARFRTDPVNVSLGGSKFMIYKKAYFKDGVVLTQSYFFDKSLSNVESVPIDHEIVCENCVGKIVHFEYRDVGYSGETRVAFSPESFDHKMKVEWQEGYDWAKVYQNKVVSDKLVIRYRPELSEEVYHVRMFDPEQNVTVLHPVNGTTYTNSTLDLNWSTQLTDLVDCWFNVDSGSKNYSINGDRCYQETANISTACGGLNNGTYEHGTGWVSNEHRLFDENIYLGASTGETGTHIFNINYSKPSNASHALWSYRRWTCPLAAGAIIVNQSIPADCINNVVQLRVYYTMGGSDTERYYCYNNSGSAWYLMYQDSCSVSSFTFYEEWIYWQDIKFQNTTLYDLSPGSHNVSVSCTDGSSTSSNISYFDVITTPEANNVTITPTVAFEDYNLSCSFDFLNSTGGTGNNASIITWYVNSALAFNNSKNLHESNFSANDNITCQVEPCDDNVCGNKVNSSILTITEYSYINLSLESLINNISVELGKIVNMSVSSNYDTVCIDVLYPGYTNNHSCGSPQLDFNLNLTYFIHQELNESKNITVLFNNSNVSFETKDFYEYATILNFTLYLGQSGSNATPENVKIYVNDTLSTVVGDLNEGFASKTVFDDEPSSFNITYNTSSIEVKYITFPDNTLVYNSNLTLTGYELSGSCYQETANQAEDCGALSTGSYNSEPNYVYMTYKKPAETNGSLSRWGVSLGEDGVQNPIGAVNYSIPLSCWDNHATNLKFRIYSSFSILSGDAIAYGQCYNGSWINVTSIYESSVASTTGFTGSVSLAYDGNYNSRTFYEEIAGEWYQFSNQINNASIYEEAMYWVYNNQSPNDPYLEVGTIDGDREWSYDGNFNITETINLTASLNNYLSTCSGECQVPFYFRSGSRGILSVDSILVNYTYSFNPVILNTTLLNAFLNSSDDYVKIPISIECSSDTYVDVYNLNISYLGGNDSLLIRAHNTNYSNNVTKNLTVKFSDWDYNFPKRINYFEFIPRTATSKNVEPYGQSSDSGILNISSRAYTNNFDFYLKINETEPTSCVNLSYSSQNNSNTSSLLENNTWTKVLSNFSLDSSQMIWMWANYSCNRTSWYAWQPLIDAKACCLNCTGCMEDE